MHCQSQESCYARCNPALACLLPCFSSCCLWHRCLCPNLGVIVNDRNTCAGVWQNQNIHAASGRHCSSRQRSEFVPVQPCLQLADPGGFYHFMTTRTSVLAALLQESDAKKAKLKDVSDANKTSAETIKQLKFGVHTAPQLCTSNKLV